MERWRSSLSARPKGHSPQDPRHLGAGQAFVCVNLVKQDKSERGPWTTETQNVPAELGREILVDHLNRSQQYVWRLSPKTLSCESHNAVWHDYTFRLVLQPESRSSSATIAIQPNQRLA